MGQLIQGANDLQTKYPNLAKEWDFAKNAPLSPDRVTCGSNRVVWWICEKGHEWQDSINHRTSGRGCPYCSHRRLDIHNSIEERFPEISREWDYERNKPKTPNQFSKGCHESVYWKCPKGHPSYKARIANRIYKGDGCPVCGGRKLLAGFNDLRSKYPVLATQWDYEKNFPVTPQDVFPREGKRYWWICPICNESYLATLANRTAGKNHKKCSQKGTSFPEQALFFM